MIICKECEGELKRIWTCKCDEPKKPKSILIERPVEIIVNKPIYKLGEMFEQNLEDVTRNHIIAVFKFYKGNKIQSARALGITVKTLYNKLKQYGLYEAKVKE